MLWRGVVLSAGLALVLLTAGCGSCAAGWAGTPYNPAAVERITMGETTRAEVLDLLGEEYIQERHPDIIRYEQVKAEARMWPWLARCETSKRGIRIQFEDGVVAGYQVIGSQ
ncbi:MAG: hypothetical protein PVJ27_07920 [Candidatus Brocadiaceae bacterium]|jgi:hypothetical protein